MSVDVPGPELSVVVASHDRPLRLRWLLNALEEQTVDASLWELVVCHDSGEETERLLREHPLGRSGQLRHTSLPAGTAPPGSNRNRALALARAPAVVFTDDDCRPGPSWLAGVLDAIGRHPGAIIQGPVIADPDEAVMLRSPYPRTQHFTDVPRPWAECANIVYPRSLLDRLGGFEESWLVGEDTDLNRRALRTGASYVGDLGMPTHHAVEEGWLPDWLRGAGRWRDLTRLFGRHPDLRRYLFARIFWKDTHGLLLLGLAGLPLARRRPAALALLLPWATARPVRGGGFRGALRQVLELPGWALIDLTEMGVLARASARERVLIL